MRLWLLLSLAAAGDPVERPASPAELIAAARSLAQESPRVELTTYATSHEGRELVYLTISSEENLGRLAAIRDDLAKLSDPRLPSSKAETARLLAETPALAYLAYGVHGDELSSGDAALQVARELVFSELGSIDAIRDQVVVLIDPVENPDGRSRILAQIASWRGAVANPDPDGMARRGAWPWGRGNHYLFDLNRDWFALVHPETRGRAKILAEWHPQLVVDAHEMGSQSTYLFNPPRWPYNRNMPPGTLDWWKRFASDHATAFDAHGWAYYTGDWNEEFFVGYGSGLPLYTGAMGLLYEQAGSRGGPVRQGHGGVLTYSETVQHQVVSSLANLGTVAHRRADLLEHYRNARAYAVDQGRRGPVAAWYFSPEGQPARAARVADALATLGIEVERLEVGGGLRLHRIDADEVGPVELPSGAYRVRLDQPDGLLANAILEPHTPMPDAFLAEERAWREREKGSRLYDATSWSPLLATGVEAWWGDRADGLQWVQLQEAEAPHGRIERGEAAFGWVWEGTADGGLVLAARLAADGVQVRVSDEPARVDGRELPRGSFLVRGIEQPEDVTAVLAAHAPGSGVTVVPVASALVEQGPDLGSDRWRLIQSARIALLVGPGLSFTSVGAAWHLLDAELGLRVSLVDAHGLAGVDLDRYNVLVAPDSWGGASAWQRALGAGGLQAVTEWVENGGTLVAIGGAAWFAASDTSQLSAARSRAAVLHDYPSVRFGLSDEAAATLAKMGARGLDAEGGAVPLAGPTHPEAWPDALGIPGPGSPVLGPGTWSLLGSLGQAARFRAPLAPVAEPLAPDKPSDDEDWQPSRSDLEARRVDARLLRFGPSGAILRAELDPEAWLCWGAGEHAAVPTWGSEALIALGSVTAAARFAAPDQLHLGGLLWPEGAGRIAHTAYLTREGRGRGQVILFAEDPNFRGQFDNTERLFLNAVLLGPGLGSRHTIPW